MEINRNKNIVRFFDDFNLLRREKQWSHSEQDRSKYYRLKMQYSRSRTDQFNSFSDDNYNTLKIRD